jgi:acetyl esterase
MAEQMMPMITSPGPDMAVTDQSIPVSDGEITVRIYRPSDDHLLPGLLYLHGGGWWQGNPDLSDPESRRTAAAAGCAVVSVDYRLAPEHPFPTPLEDSYAALLWMAANADRLGVDPQRIAIAGGSAGANLAAAVALLARDRSGARLVAQVLVVPATDLTWGQQSVIEFGEGYGLDKLQLDYCAKAYVGENGDPRNPLISPLFADLHSLPPALIITAEYDPIKDQGDHYAERLREAGVAAELICLPGMLHGSFALDKIVPDAADTYYQTIGSFLTGIFGRARAHDVAVSAE